MFTFVFRFRLDGYLFERGDNSLYTKSPEITIPDEIIKSMRMSDINSFKISEIWKDFPLINDIILKVKNIFWKCKSLYIP